VNSDIRYLQLLEDDLREAAQFERELDEEDRARAARGTTQTVPRRLPRRGGNWGRVAVVLVVFVVVAGGIGFLTQTGSKQSNSARLATGAASPSSIRQRNPGGTHYAALQPPPAAPGQDKGGSGHLAGTAQGDLSKIVRDGTIGVLLVNGAFTQGVADVTQIARRNGGMVLSTTSENDRSGTFVLRIPAKHFDDTMLALRGLGHGGQILYQTATGKDVTADFIDLHARLVILKGRRALLIGIQDKATDVSQILSLGSQIDQVTLQIEQIQGNLNYINHQVAESTIKVELREKDAPQSGSSTDIDNPSLRSAWHFSIQGSLRVMGAVVIGLGYLVPLSVIALLVWGVVTLARRRRPAAS
jgi:hypothetical protein